MKKINKKNIIIIEISYRSVELSVVGTYAKGEDATNFDSNLSGFPGSFSEFDINAVFVGDIDIYELFDWEYLEDLSEACLKKIED
jgi:hypothetical protein